MSGSAYDSFQRGSELLEKGDFMAAAIPLPLQIQEVPAVRQEKRPDESRFVQRHIGLKDRDRYAARRRDAPDRFTFD